MPELPEVEVVRRGLQDHVVGGASARRSSSAAGSPAGTCPGPPTSPPGSPATRCWRPSAAASTSGSSCEAPDAHRQALIIHLGMSGQLLVEAPDAPAEKHLHARVRLRRRRPAAALRRPAHLRRDGPRRPRPRRRHGLARHGPPVAGVPSTITHIAPDPFEPGYDRAAVVARLQARRTGIKRALLDQGLVSGVGNIYADEALWRAQAARRARGRHADPPGPRPAAGPRRAR